MIHPLIKTSVFAAILSLGGILPAASKAAETSAHVVTPNSAGAIWLAVDQHVQKLHALIAQDKLDMVHEQAYAIRDLTAALPSHSPNLSPDARAKVTAQVKFVNILAERLDQMGDAKDKTGTEDNLRKLEAVLKRLRALYA